MLLSIIIHTLNEEHFIGGLLTDLTLQTYTNFEVLHIDGKSQDRTCEVVASHKKKLDIQQYVSSKRNVSYQKNMGAEYAKGEYFIFIDADTRIHDTAFLNNIAKKISYSRHLLYFPMVDTNVDDIAVKIAFNVYNKAVEIARLSPNPLNPLGVAIFENYFFSHMKGYALEPRQTQNMLFAEDHEIYIRAKKMGVTGAVVHDAHYIYSLRRFKREGYLKVVPKYILSNVERILGTDFVRSNYEMGGHLYKEPK